MADINMSADELISRFAEVQQITVEEAREQVGADTPEEVLKKIQDKTIEKINGTRVPMNRAQRRALKKKVGAKKYEELGGDVMGAINDTAAKLNYIDLIQKLRKLNEEKAKENDDGETTTEND